MTLPYKPKLRAFLAPGLLRIARDVALVNRSLEIGKTAFMAEPEQEGTYDIGAYLVPPGHDAIEYGGTFADLSDFLYYPKVPRAAAAAWKRLSKLGWRIAYSD